MMVDADINTAQVFLQCGLCNQPFHRFCNTCQLGLCEHCIGTHVRSLPLRHHDIVPYRNRRVQQVFSRCIYHPHQTCEAYCHNCDVPICIRCLAGPQHKTHIVINVVEKRALIKKETEKINDIINQNGAAKFEVNRRILQSNSHFSDLLKKAEYHRKQWYLEVNSIFDNLESLIKSQKDHHVKELVSCKLKLNNRVYFMIQTVKKNKEILRTNNLFYIKNYKFKVADFRKSVQIPDPPHMLVNTKDKRERCITFEKYRASLKQTPMPRLDLTYDVQSVPRKVLLKIPKVITNIPLKGEKLRRIVCTSLDKAWMCGNRKLVTLVDIHGLVRGTIETTCLDFPGDIALSRQGELMYTDVAHRTVNIVRYGKSKTLIVTPKFWHPQSLCCTLSGDILLSMFASTIRPFIIVRYEGQRLTQIIKRDEHNCPIFQTGKHALIVTENTNGDIVTSDKNADKVVVVSRSGKVRFRYNIKPVRGKKPFCPGHVVTDSVGHIIVVDSNNTCLHILNQDGLPMNYVDYSETHYTLRGLSLDSMDRLWVGLKFSTEHSELRVIQYMSM